VKNVEVLHTVKEEMNTLHKMNRRKATWIGYILHWNCLLQHSIERKTEGMGKMRKKTKEANG
jgi:hypothetical protein